MPAPTLPNFSIKFDTISQGRAVMTSASAPHSLPYFRAALWGVSQFLCLTSRPQGKKGRGNTQVRISPWASDSGSCQSLVSAAWMICLSTTRTCGIILKITTWAPRKLELQDWDCQWTWKRTGTRETWHTYACVLQLQTSTGVSFLRLTLISNILVSCVIWRKTVGGINHKKAIFSL